MQYTPQDAVTLVDHFTRGPVPVNQIEEMDAFVRRLNRKAFKAGCSPIIDTVGTTYVLRPHCAYLMCAALGIAPTLEAIVFDGRDVVRDLVSITRGKVVDSAGHPLTADKRIAAAGWN